MPKPRTLLTVLLACAALLLVACGDDEPSDSGSGSEATPTATSGETKLPTVSEKLGEKPAVGDTAGDPPAELQNVDVVEGDGKAAKEGDNVSVQYVGINWSKGTQFDASWDKGQAFDFTLGAGNVIQGWDEGVVGMKEGGRRLLVIPPDKGYGPEGTPDGSIPPNETLVFVVDLEKVTAGQG